MPQIRCPNCGTTINLENRKETDFRLLLNALKSKERSFSELLRITGLPRKTLSLRLHELCRMNAIIKNKLYYWNEEYPHKELERKIMKGNSRFLAHKKAIILFLLFCIGFPVTTNVFAMFFLTPPPEPGPIGYFKAIVTVNNVSDVYGWQVGLRFNSTNLKVVNVNPGGFLIGIDQYTDNVYDVADQSGVKLIRGTLFCHRVVEDGILVIGQSLLGNISGISGGGSLAVIEFEYYCVYQEPELIFNGNPLDDTMLARIDTSEIPLDENTVTIHFLP